MNLIRRGVSIVKKQKGIYLYVNIKKFNNIDIEGMINYLKSCKFCNFIMWARICTLHK